MKKDDINSFLFQIRRFHNFLDLGDAMNYVYSLLFFKFLSSQLEDYFNGMIQDKELMLFEAYEDGYYGELFKKEAVANFGYYISYDNLFDSIIARMNERPEYLLENLFNAFKEISDSSKSGTAYGIFDLIFNEEDMHSKKVILFDYDINEAAYSMMKFIASDEDISVESLFSQAMEYHIEALDRRKDPIASENDVNRLIGEIAKAYIDDPSSIYDPFMGTARLLEALFALCNDPTVAGQEIDLKFYDIALMNLLIHGVDINKLDLFLGDTISNPGHLDRKFDIIVSVPPLASINRVSFKEIKGKERFEEYGINKFKAKFDYNIVPHMLYNLEDDGVIVILINRSLLSRKFDESIKQVLIEEKNYLDAVVDLPDNLFSEKKMESSLLVFRKNRNAGEKVLFVDASNEYEKQRKKYLLGEKQIEKIVDVFKTKSEDENFSKLVGISEIKENKFNLTSKRYFDTYEGEFIVFEDALEIKRKLNKEMDEINKKIAELSRDLDLDKEILE